MGIQQSTPESVDPGTRDRLHGKLALALALGTAFLFTLYLQLPYRSSWFVALSESEVSSAPAPRFQMGSLEWRVDEYAVSPRLEPFRREFRENCGELRGYPAALCVSDVMARQFPFGTSGIDMFDSRFEPTEHLQAHKAGAPGHCVNRSAILAGQLLAVGIPARVVQLIPLRRPGHTVVEVWDDGFGWTLVDPTFGGVVGDGVRPTSALHLLSNPEASNWYRLSDAPAPTSLVGSTRRQGPDPALFRAHLVYPEPWLYLRVGPRPARWPFRANFGHLSAGRVPLGLAHAILRLGIIACTFGSLVFCVSFLVASPFRPLAPHRRTALDSEPVRLE